MLLPSKIFYYDIPLIYATNDKDVICLYAFDKKKKVILVSDYNHYTFRYISLFEFEQKNYHFIHNRYGVEDIHHKLESIIH